VSGSGDGFLGRRVQHVQLPEVKQLTQTAPNGHGLKPLRVADSDLLVVKAWLLGSDIAGFAEAKGGKVRFRKYDWSDQLVADCDCGSLDVAIYNTAISERYCESTSNNAVRVSQSVGSSMHGRNFCMIVRADHPLVSFTISEIREYLSDVTIYVGRYTDRFSNLMLALGVVDDGFWSERNIRIVDLPDPKLEVLDTDPEGILVPGQNLRFEAHLRGGYCEVVSYESLERNVCDELRRRSANSLLVGRDYDLGYGEPRQLVSELQRRFRANTSDDEFVAQLVEDLVDCCDFGRNSDSDKTKLARHVLFETYDIGVQQW
jgi:hypothetical protein